MATLLSKFEAEDIIAIVVLIGAFAMKFGGADGLVSFIIVSVVAYYFGKRNGGVPQKALDILLKKEELARFESKNVG